MDNNIKKVLEILEKTWGDEAGVIKLEISDSKKSGKVLYYHKRKDEFIVHSVNLHEGCEGLHNGDYCNSRDTAEKCYYERRV